MLDETKEEPLQQSRVVTRLYDYLDIGLAAIPINLWSAFEAEAETQTEIRNSGLVISLPSELPVRYTGAAAARRSRRVISRTQARKWHREERARASAVQTDDLAVDSNGTALPSEQVHDDYISASHGAGDVVWTFDLINSTDWGPAETFLQITAADAILFQELKRTTPLACKEAEDKASKAGWKLTVAAGVSTAAGGRAAGNEATPKPPAPRKVCIKLI